MKTRYELFVYVFALIVGVAILKHLADTKTPHPPITHPTSADGR